MIIKINPECCWGGEQEKNLYVSKLIERIEKHPISPNKKLLSYAKKVNDDGYCKIENFFEKEKLLKIKNEFELFKKNKKLQYDDYYTEQVAHPLSTMTTIFDVVFDDKIIDLAATYFGCLPSLNNVQLRKSKATDVDPKDLPKNGQTTRFHCDRDSPRFLKFFFYLDDVDKDNGPFTYVKQSHLNKVKGWRNKYRWSDREVANLYGEENVIEITGKVGDLLVGNTSGLHKGKKVTKGERLMMTVYFSVHPTQWQTTYGGRIREEDYQRLPEHKRPLADFLTRI